MKDYFVRYNLASTGDNHCMAWGIVSFSAKSSRHARRKLTAGLDELEGEVGKVCRETGWRIVFVGDAYESRDKIKGPEHDYLGFIDLSKRK